MAIAIGENSLERSETNAPGIVPDAQQTFAAGFDPAPPSHPDAQQTFAAGLDPAPPAETPGDLTFAPGLTPSARVDEDAGDMTLLPPTGVEGSETRAPQRGTGRQHAPLDGDATFAGGPLPPPEPRTGPLPQDPDATLLQPADYPAAIGSGAGPDEAHTLMAVPGAMNSGFGRAPGQGRRGERAQVWVVS